MMLYAIVKRPRRSLWALLHDQMIYRGRSGKKRYAMEKLGKKASGLCCADAHSECYHLSDDDKEMIVRLEPDHDLSRSVVTWGPGDKAGLIHELKQRHAQFLQRSAKSG